MNKTVLLMMLILLAIFPPLSTDMYLSGFIQIALFLHTSQAGIQLSLTIFLFGYTFTQLIFGPISDYFGRKPVLLTGITIYIIGSIGCVFSITASQFYLARLVQAIGAGSGAVISLAVIKDRFEHKERLYYLGLISTIMGFAPLVAPIIGGYIIKFYEWQYIFGILVACGLVSIFFALLMEETNKSLSESIFNKIFSNYIKMFLLKEFIYPTLAGGFAFAAMFVYISGSPSIFIDIFGVNVDKYGYYFAVNAIAIIMGNFLAMRISRIVSSYMIQLYFNIFLSMSSLVLVLVNIYFNSIYGIVIPMFFVSLSIGGILPTTTANAIQRININIGQASALITFIRFGSATLITWIVSKLNFTDCLQFSCSILACAVLALPLSFRTNTISLINSKD